MARYIDAYSLSNKVFKSKKNNPHCIDAVARNHNCEHEHFLKMIADEPTADVAEVVRCKDCEQFMQQYDIHNGLKLHYGICKLNSNKFHDEEVNCDHYCSYGEKKEGIKNE